MEAWESFLKLFSQSWKWNDRNDLCWSNQPTSINYPSENSRLFHTIFHNMVSRIKSNPADIPLLVTPLVTIPSRKLTPFRKSKMQIFNVFTLQTNADLSENLANSYRQNHHPRGWAQRFHWERQGYDPGKRKLIIEFFSEYLLRRTKRAFLPTSRNWSFASGGAAGAAG